ncbi:TIM barrel protein [Kaistia dalseonensis]|uniref:3-dehydroshikimate dehydratase n=1 Tax=Kaistia dalseonensis TaxID=410840 RepID=A0ABU0H9Y9_9HYPH|nr:sugar phosphate isomerase/epimerase and 4-hydroxyphenylpyruvate domain-containing protein [Kaistia dalseonensis]MCX5496511.1 TIM barrel protein [Kaistia dalseonensis]MDQ0439133.1 4-hydroxyphenylpyruvate dioxygenase [Kaistia dalseonensis]
MKTSIATVSISGDLAEKLQAIAAAGFDGVEIFETDFLTFNGSPREVGQMVKDRGLEITVFQPFRDFEGLPEPHRTRAFDRAKRKFDLMAELGTDLMLVCSSVSPLALGGIDRAAADLHELGDIAERMGMRIGYEALAWGRHVNDHRDAWEIVRRADHRYVGLVLDSFHTLARRIDPDTIRSIPGDKIFIVQLADAPMIDMNLLSWSRHFRNMPGEGDLNVVDFMRAVVATGYDGPLSLEVFNDQFRGGSPGTIAIDGHRSLVYLMDQVRRAEPSLAVGTPALPERGEVEGVEFIEFAADDADAERLGRAFKQMGFARAGRHRSKDVTLYRQGDINLIVNTEREGLAHSAYITHGTSAYAIGLRVADACGTIERGVALGAQSFSQPVAAGELMIPAIRGLGGGIIYFVDQRSDLGRLWDVDFVTAPPEPGFGLTRVDHIAQTTDYGEMLTWLLFYQSILAVRKSPMVDVLDPGGLVRSQAIENESGTLRLTLNGADNSRTLAGRFITATFGSAVQHLAFATDDIFASAEAMRQAGFDSLPISENYYDDIAARFGLDDEFIGTLKRLHILYDQDGTGEFFQLYSRTSDAGFFLEVVQRSGGYQGYGAVNAPFRIAAQRWTMPPGPSD